MTDEVMKQLIQLRSVGVSRVRFGEDHELREVEFYPVDWEVPVEMEKVMHGPPLPPMDIPAGGAIVNADYPWVGDKPADPGEPQPLDEQCACGHMLEIEHSIAGCLHGCAESLCATTGAAKVPKELLE